MESNIPLNCWMSGFQDSALLSLSLPGTHNSSSYDLQHSSFILSNRISCQSQPIPKQLNDGIRAIDLRICSVVEGSDTSYWTAHGPRFCKLEDCLQHIKHFLKANQTEFVFLNIAPEWSPMKDIRFAGWLRGENKSQVQPKLNQKQFTEIVHAIIVPFFD